jgi:aryl-alcohol dehydrogenase-like predicted oxidoreductase
VSVKRLCLGTVKLGLPWYGAGSLSRPTPEDISAILCRAQALGVTHYDTGAAYGDAEDWCQQALAQRAQVVTKVGPALARLGALTFRTYEPGRWAAALLHNPTVADLADLTLREALREATGDGLAPVGASVYTPEEALAAMDAGLTVLQVPYSVYDHRHGGVLAEAHGRGVTTYARGPFLQGLPMLSDGTLRAVKMGQAAREHGWDVRDAIHQLYTWRGLARDHGIPLLDAHLWWSLDSPADYVVFGVGSLAHLEAVLAAAAAYHSGDTRWALLKEAAGACDLGAPPLTFGSLWRAPTAAK